MLVYTYGYLWQQLFTPECETKYFQKSNKYLRYLKIKKECRNLPQRNMQAQVSQIRGYETGCILRGTVICRENNSYNLKLCIDQFPQTFIIFLKNLTAYLYLPLY